MSRCLLLFVAAACLVGVRVRAQDAAKPATPAPNVTFAGEIEHPDPGEVIFADADAKAHARRWCNRQSRRSAVGDGTRRALIVAEALHESAVHDIDRLTASLADAVSQACPTCTVRRMRLR
jgi:DNA/RNA-binding domain of Phe-tRNA-synthetase-like protein